MNAKNIDCVTLDADLVACDALTIQGVPITGIADITTKTQNISLSTTNSRTLHTAAFQSADIETTRITGIDSTGLQIQSIMDQSVSNAANSIALYLVNPTLGTSSNTVGFHIGTSKTTSNAAWQMLYVNTNLSGSTSNRLDFKSLNQGTTLSMITGKVGVNTTAPTEALDVSGNAKVSGTMSVTGQVAAPIGQQLGAIAWNSTAGVNSYKTENILATALLLNTSYFPRVYTLYFTNLKSSGYAAGTDKPFIRVGYGGATTTWSSNYNGWVTRAGDNNQNMVKEEVTTTGIPVYPIPAGITWGDTYSHSGQFTLTYMFAAGGGYIYRWDYSSTLAIVGAATEATDTVKGSGYIFNTTATGRPTALGIFYGATNTTSNLLTAQIVSAHIQ